MYYYYYEHKKIFASMHLVITFVIVNFKVGLEDSAHIEIAS